MNYRETVGLVIGAGVIFGGLTTLLLGTQVLAPTETLEHVALIEIFFSTFNVIVLTALTVNYLTLYRDIPTSTSRSLTIFSAALLLYAVSSSPVVHVLMGLKLITIGPLTYIPEVFVAAAALVLLYESYK